MREAGIGRVLVASLHQGIADILPTRLAFYENWLNAEGLREGTIGLAPLYAVLSFLRQEGDAYKLITTRAGEYAADWTVQSMPPFQQAMLKARAAVAPQAPPAASGAAPGAQQLQGQPGDLTPARRARRASNCARRCSARFAKRCRYPLCGFYRAAFTRLLALFDISASTEIVACRGDRRGDVRVEGVDRQPRSVGIRIRRGAMTRWPIAVGLALTLVAPGPAAQWGTGTTAAPAASSSRVLVMPFENVTREGRFLAHRGLRRAAGRRPQRARRQRDHAHGTAAGVRTPSGPASLRPDRRHRHSHRAAGRRISGRRRIAADGGRRAGGSRAEHRARHRAREGRCHRARTVARAVHDVRTDRAAHGASLGNFVGRPRKAAPAGGRLRGLHQGTARRHPGDGGQLPAGRAGRTAVVRSGAPRAVGCVRGAGRPRAGARRRRVGRRGVPLVPSRPVPGRLIAA